MNGHEVVALLIGFLFATLGAKANPVNPDALVPTPLPSPVMFSCDMDTPVAFDSSTTVAVACPEVSAVDWLGIHFVSWYGKNAPRVSSVSEDVICLPSGDESYAIIADSNGIRMAARSLAGVRWAAYTLRQLATAKRGTLKTVGYTLPKLKITDYPHLGFRAVHLCWFPEVRPEQIERAIRLAALLKFNYAIIEQWGMYESAKHPWWHWPNPTMTKERVHHLVALGRDLGITLVPQINVFGHASSSRGFTLKHAVLDLYPEYEPLFEPGGWNWCISNPETQRVLRELIAEMHEDFGNPPYFHLGCDEAQPPSCLECCRTQYSERVCRHIASLADFVKARGARAMIWHDMLLERGDPRWEKFVHHGNRATATLVDALPKDVIVCDWQYSYGNMKQDSSKEWPTMAYFKEKGFLVAGCPWMNYNAMKPMADFIVRIGGFGFIETTWHHLRGSDWVNMYRYASAAAWGTSVAKEPPMFDVQFAIVLRLVGHDMKVGNYLDTGHLNYQVPPGWWVDNN